MAEVTTRVKLSSADRVLFPDDGVTKGDLFAYYGRLRRLAPAAPARPAVHDEAVPEGIDGEVFFQKQAPKGMPDWIPTRQFRRIRARAARGSSTSRSSTRPRRGALDGADTLHRHERVVLARRQAAPADFVLFDLDPPEEPDGFELAIEVAHLIRELLDEVGLPGYVKTSGADGIHVVAPITRRSTFEQTYDFAEQASRLLEARHPGLAHDGVAEEEARGRARRPPAERLRARRSRPSTRCGRSPARRCRRRCAGTSCARASGRATSRWRSRSSAAQSTATSSRRCSRIRARSRRRARALAKLVA